mgnify:CR=1 FL=1
MLGGIRITREKSYIQIVQACHDQLTGAIQALASIGTLDYEKTCEAAIHKIEHIMKVVYENYQARPQGDYT